MLLKKIAIAVIILSPASVFATWGAATAFDVQTTGANTNGGGFDSGVGSPGTNESLGSGTAITVTLTGTTTGTGSVAFSATTHGPGNFVHIASGTGCTTGWYEIVSQSSGTATFDRAMGSSTNTCVGVIGGSLLTIDAIYNATGTVAGYSIWVKTGTYTVSSTISAGNGGDNIIEGYGTTHGDMGTPPLITTATNSTNLFRSASGGNIYFVNITASNTASTRGQFFGVTNPVNIMLLKGKYTGFSYVLFGNAGGAGGFTTMVVKQVEITGSTTGALVNDFSNVDVIVDCYIHDNTGIGYNAWATIGNGYVTIVNNIFSNNTGSAIALPANFNQAFIRNNTFFNNTGPQIDLTQSSTYTIIRPLVIENNVFSGGTFGVKGSTNGTAIMPLESYNNAYYNQSTAPTTNFTDTNPITLTANPFTNTSTNDYSLNTTAGGGALLRAGGLPGAFPGATSTGYLDVGAVQHADPAAAGASNYGFAQ